MLKYNTFSAFIGIKTASYLGNAGLMVQRQDTKLFDVAFSDGTPRKAFLTACVVGTVLTVINHGDLIISGQLPPLIKIVLTYLTPFYVTFQKSGLKPPTSVGKDFNCAPQAL